MGVEAQNRSIGFEQTREWKKVIKKAKKEKKLIFVDCYTSWCGPCKMLAKDVFTRDEVADYFNVTQNTIVPDNSMVIGSPASVKRQVLEREVESNCRNAEIYIKEGKDYADFFREKQ